MFARYCDWSILVAALVLACSLAAATAEIERNFTSCGGAERCFSAQKLERIRRRSGFHTHKSQRELTQQLDQDDDLGVDTTNDMLVFACAGLTAAEPRHARAHDEHKHHHRSLKGLLPAAAAEIASGWLPSMPDAAITKAQAFALHSRPNATRKILLDFDGHNTTGTAWNAQKNLPAITTPPYDKDGIPSSWSAAELSDILAIWRGVSEDFAPWDVDVTTEDPGDAYLATAGIRVAIGGSYKDWFVTAAGGVAYVGVFGKYSGYYAPAFIFPKDLGNCYAKYVWEAASHEVAHTLGLSHDGQKSGVGVTGTAYYGGQGSWAPIMGVGYNKPVTQWSKGEYYLANNLEDDIAIMSTYLGPVTAIPQEDGTNLTTATLLVGTPSASHTTATARASGIIRQPSNQHVYSIVVTTPGNITVQLVVAALWGTVPRSNLNATVTVMDAQGNTIKAAAGVGVGPLDTPAAAAGTYFISVAPTGSGDPLTTGYSPYASMGQFELQVTYSWAAAANQTSGASGTAATGSPSPAPSPVPSPAPPSPSPALPSPSPALPSPSPTPPSPSPSPPSPSPSPPPSSNTMNLSSIVITKTVNNRGQVTCKATVTVVMSANGTKAGRVSVTGSWKSAQAATGWPITAAASSTGATGTSLGTVSFTASRSLPSAAGNGCAFTVTSWTKSGLVKDASAVLGPVWLRW